MAASTTGVYSEVYLGWVLLASFLLNFANFLLFLCLESISTSGLRLTLFILAAVDLVVVLLASLTILFARINLNAKRNRRANGPVSPEMQPYFEPPYAAKTAHKYATYVFMLGVLLVYVECTIASSVLWGVQNPAPHIAWNRAGDAVLNMWLVGRLMLHFIALWVIKEFDPETGALDSDPTESPQDTARFAVVRVVNAALFSTVVVTAVLLIIFTICVLLSPWWLAEVMILLYAYLYIANIILDLPVVEEKIKFVKKGWSTDGLGMSRLKFHEHHWLHFLNNSSMNGLLALFFLYAWGIVRIFLYWACSPVAQATCLYGFIGMEIFMLFFQLLLCIMFAVLFISDRKRADYLELYLKAEITVVHEQVPQDEQEATAPDLSGNASRVVYEMVGNELVPLLLTSLSGTLQPLKRQILQPQQQLVFQQQMQQAAQHRRRIVRSEQEAPVYASQFAQGGLQWSGYGDMRWSDS